MRILECDQEKSYETLRLICFDDYIILLAVRVFVYATGEVHDSCAWLAFSNHTGNY